MKGIYFDNAATSPVRPEVIQAMSAAFAEVPGNPSSLHTFGQKAKRTLEQARVTVAAVLGATPAEVFFTSGGTESNNLAIKGYAYAHAERGRHIITTPIEHHAVLNVALELQAQGFELSIVPVDAGGVVDLDALRAALRPDTVLISVMLANNEVGIIEPVREAVEIARAWGIAVHTDAVQAVGKIPVDVRELGVDLLSLTAHKFYGPKGQGVLYVKKGTGIKPLFEGGHQERAIRAGTESIPTIVGLATALQLAVRDLSSEAGRLAALRDRLEAGIQARVPDVRVNGDPDRRVPNISNMSFAFIEGESLLLALDTMGIAVSTGSACNAGSTEPSHVLRGMGLDRTLAQGSLRFSLGRQNTEAEVDRVVEVVAEAVSRLRELSPLTGGELSGTDRRGDSPAGTRRIAK